MKYVLGLVASFAMFASIVATVDAAPIHLAAEYGDPDRIQQELNSGASVNDIDQLGDTPLIRAVMAGSNDNVSMLIENNADVNHANIHGLTALGLAVTGNHRGIVNTGIVNILIENNANVNCADEVEGWTPLMTASYQGDTLTVKTLIANNADANHTSQRGDTALSLAQNESLAHSDEIKKLIEDHIFNTTRGCKTKPATKR